MVSHRSSLTHANREKLTTNPANVTRIFSAPTGTQGGIVATEEETEGLEGANPRNPASIRRFFFVGLINK